MATVTLATASLHGLVLKDPAGLLPDVILNGPGRAWGVHGGHIPLGGAGVTSGVDAELWRRWAAAHPSLVPNAVYLVETPAPGETPAAIETPAAEEAADGEAAA